MISVPALALIAAAVVTSDAPFVLAVGVNDPKSEGLTPLRFADDDAIAALSVFGADTASGRGTILSVLDVESQQAHPAFASMARAPTLRELRSAVQSLLRRLDEARAEGRAPSVVIWLSGHAEPGQDGRTRFLLADGEGLDEHAVRTELLEPLRAAHRIQLFIDSCFAGGLVRARAQVGKASTAEAARAFARMDESPLPNVGVWLSSSTATRSWEWEQVGAGVFSAIVRAGLRGSADANGDEVVRTSELAGWIAAAVEGVRLGDARPRVTVLPPPIDRDAVVVERAWSQGTALLHGELSAHGPLHVVDGAGNWLLAASFEPGFHAALWLPTSVRLWLVTKHGERVLEEWGGSFRLGEPTQGAVQPRSPMSVAAMDEALRDGLFATPYGPAFLRGFRAASARPRAPTQQESDPWPLPALAALTVGGASLAGSVVTGAIAATSFVAWADTDRERQARDAFTQGAVFAVASVALLGVGGMFTVLGAGPFLSEDAH